MPRLMYPSLCMSVLISTGIFTGCDTAPEHVEEFLPLGALEGSAKMRGFSWVINDQVAAMPRPGGSRPLDRDLQFLSDQGIDVLVSLTEVPVDPMALRKYNIEPLHIPVPDFHPPTQDQLDQYVAAVVGWQSEGRSVGTHCGAGLGRTGTFMAALFVVRGMDADAAIAKIRQLRPGSIETIAQENAVRDFAARQAKKCGRDRSTCP